MQSKENITFMQMAIDLATQGIREGKGGPFGCLIVKDGKVVGKGFNSVLATKDPTAHAEMVAIRDACKNLDSALLEGCEIYTSCAPCPMCLGAMYWAKPDKVYYACSQSEAAEAGFDDQLIYEEMNVAVDKRKIPFAQITPKTYMDPFNEWNEKEDKT